MIQRLVEEHVEALATIVRRISRGVPCHGKSRTVLATVQADLAAIRDRISAMQGSRGPVGGGEAGDEPGASDLQALVTGSEHLGGILDHFQNITEHFIFDKY